MSTIVSTSPVPRNATHAAIVISLIATAPVVGCGNMVPPARNSGAVLSAEGVLFAVVGQRCSEHRFGEPSEPSFDGTFAVEVGNPTLIPLTLYPDRLILRGRKAVGVRPSPSENAISPTVDAGTTAPFTIHFTASGLGCSDELTLDPRSAIVWNGRPINLPEIRFVPVENSVLLTRASQR